MTAGLTFSFRASHPLFVQVNIILELTCGKHLNHFEYAVFKVNFGILKGSPHSKILGEQLMSLNYFSENITALNATFHHFKKFSSCLPCNVVCIFLLPAQSALVLSCIERVEEEEILVGGKTEADKQLTE